MEKSLEEFMDGLAKLGPSQKSNSLLNGGNLFDTLLKEPLLRKLGEQAMIEAKKVMDLYFKAVLSCRKGQVPEALVQLIIADGLFDELAPAAGSFVVLYKLSAWGNYFYIAHENEKAIELLKKGLAISAELESNGYELLIYRRIEQLQNIANIYFKAGETTKGYLLLKNVLTFIHSGKQEGLFIDDWNPALISKTRFLQESMLDSVFNQLAVQEMTSGNKTIDDYQYSYELVYKDLFYGIEVDTNNRQVVYNWIFTKKSLYEEGSSAFLKNVIEFLADQQISSSYDILRTNLLVLASDVISSAFGNNSRQAIVQLCNFIDHDLQIDMKLKSKVTLISDSHLYKENKQSGSLIIDRAV